MILERRASARKPVDQEVMIFHAQGHRLCKIHDLSLRGAMLNLGWGALTRDVPVELVMSLPTGEGRASYRVAANVARVTTAGTAIKFRELDGGAYNAMQRYLRAE